MCGSNCDALALGSAGAQGLEVISLRKARRRKMRPQGSVLVKSATPTGRGERGPARSPPPSADGKRAMNPTTSIAILEPDDAARDSLSFYLSAAGHAVRAFASLAGFRAAMGAAPIAVALLDLSAHDAHAFAFVRELRAARPETLVVTMSCDGGDRAADDAVAAGAAMFLEKPFNPDALLYLLGQMAPADARVGEEFAPAADAETLHMSKTVRAIPHGVVSIRAAISSGGSADAVQVRILGLEDAGDVPGDKEARFCARVQGAALYFLHARLAGDDIVVPVDGGFVIVYAQPPGRNLTMEAATVASGLSGMFRRRADLKALRAQVSGVLIKADNLPAILPS
jgi:FixJ family two-component response regulator